MKLIRIVLRIALLVVLGLSALLLVGATAIRQSTSLTTATTGCTVSPR